MYLCGRKEFNLLVNLTRKSLLGSALAAVTRPAALQHCLRDRFQLQRSSGAKSPNSKHGTTNHGTFCALSEAPRLSVWRRKQRQQNGKVIIIIQKLSEKDFQFSLVRSARVVGTLLSPPVPATIANFLVLMTVFAHDNDADEEVDVYGNVGRPAKCPATATVLFAAMADEVTRSRRGRRDE